MIIPINKKTKQKLKSFTNQQIEHIIETGINNFSYIDHGRTNESISVMLSTELADRVAELSLRKGKRQSQVLTSLLTTYCLQFQGTETLYQQQIHHNYGGEREVYTPVGRIDLLTDEYIVEVKESKCWKHAIGQVLCYDQYKPGRQKVIALFGKISNKLKGEVEYCCSNLDIDIWWL